MHYIVSFVVFTIFSIVAEFILLSIIDNSDNQEMKSNLRKICKFVFILLAVFYSLLLVFIGVVAISNFKNGQIETGIKMIITVVILAVGIYFLFIRKIRLKISK